MIRATNIPACNLQIYDQQSACKHTSNNWKRVRNEVSVSYNVRPRFIIKAIAGDEVCTNTF